MKVIVGSRRGHLKVVSVEAKVVNTFQCNNVEQPIDSLCWASTRDESEVIAAHTGGDIERIRLCDGQVVATFSPNLDSATSPPLRYCGLDLIPNKDEAFVSCSETGNVFYGSLDGQSHLVDVFSFANPVERMKVGCWNDVCVIAAGGKENDVAVWDFEQQKQTWKAKNIRNDNLNMRHPIWVRDIAFLQSKEHTLVVGTSFRQLRVYDCRAQRRPVHNLLLTESPIIRTCTSSDGRYVILGTAQGDLCQVDIRKLSDMSCTAPSSSVDKRCVVGMMKGISASVADVKCHIRNPFVASCTLDCFLHVHSLSNLKAVTSIYLKQQGYALLFSEEEAVHLPASTDEGQKPVIVQDVWDQKGSRRGSDSEHEKRNDDEDKKVNEKSEKYSGKRRKTWKKQSRSKRTRK